MLTVTAALRDDPITGIANLNHNVLVVLCVAISVVLRLCSTKLHKNIFSPCRWATDDDTCCPKRKARFFKCVKRAARRKAQCGSKEGEGWSCPFECKFARIHMPAPLPFRRKKRPNAKAHPTPSINQSQSAEPLNKKDKIQFPTEQDDIDPTEACTSSDESITSAETQSKSLSHKSKRRHRRKRRPSSSTDTETLATIITPSLSITSTTLIDLALMQNWPQLLVNVKANKRQARQRDADGLYPLHWAVSGGPPLEVVRALLKAYPGATKKVDSEGSNALHFSSHYGASVDVVKVVLDTYPKAISVVDKYGRSPLWHAADKGANLDVLKTLATAGPNMITTSCRPKNYLQLEKEGKRWSYLTPLYLSWVNFLTDERSVETCSGKVWGKAGLLLKLGYCHQHRLPLDVEVPVVAAIVSLDTFLPQELAGVVLKGLPSDELLRIDPATGKNPLALAANSTQLSPERSDELIRLLLGACPAAATALDSEGKTPLANAAEKGKVWDLGLARLFNAYPEALSLSDNTTGLTPPLLLAASSPQSTNLNHRESAILADPYRLVGIKALAFQQIAFERGRKREVLPKEASKLEKENQHLSSLFDLIKADPSWIVATAQ